METFVLSPSIRCTAKKKAEKKNLTFRMCKVRSCSNCPASTKTVLQQGRRPFLQCHYEEKTSISMHTWRGTSPIMQISKGSSSTVLIFLIVLVAASIGNSSPVIHHDVDTTVALPRPSASLELIETSFFNGTKSAITQTTSTPSSEIEEGRGRKKKIKKRIYFHLWNVVYYYAWFVGILIVKFKAVVLFLLANLTFFVISLIRMLIREVPLWNYLKRATSPAPAYGPPQYTKYGPPGSPLTTYTQPSSTYGTPSNSYEHNSYSPLGLYKRQGSDKGSEGDGGNLNAHELAYGGQRE